MKGGGLIALIVFVSALVIGVIILAFFWLPEGDAIPKENDESISIPAEPIEKQLRESPNYTRSQVNDLVTCTKDEITFEFKDGKPKLCISFGGHATTVDCSVYLPRHRDIHKTISEVEGKTREDHLRASCVSL